MLQPLSVSGEALLRNSDVANVVRGNSAGRQKDMESIVVGMDVTMKPLCVFTIPSIILTSLLEDVPLIMRFVTPAVNASPNVELPSMSMMTDLLTIPSVTK